MATSKTKKKTKTKTKAKTKSKTKTEDSISFSDCRYDIKFKLTPMPDKKKYTLVVYVKSGQVDEYHFDAKTIKKISEFIK